MAGKIQIDPAHPLGSMTAGDQQFTIAGDTDHRKEGIHAAINADIPTMARNGVKHIMVEFSAQSLDEMAQTYPAMAQATTWDERRKVLLAESTRIYDLRQQVILKELSGLDPDRDSAKWNAAFDRGYKRADATFAAQLDTLMEAQYDLACHELLDRVYSKPPRISDAEILVEAKKYAAVMADDQAQSGVNFGNLLIESRKAGITVHFTGDIADFQTRSNLKQASDAITRHVESNPKYAENWERVKNERGFVIPPEDQAGQHAYMQELYRLGEIEKLAIAAKMALRTDPVREQQRVDRILAAANGEKAVVVWGSNHASKLNDFNEMLDTRLAEQAARAGKPAPTPTAVLELYLSRNHHSEIAYLDGPDEPDARFYIDEREVEITPSGATRLDLKAATTGQSLGVNEYAAFMERMGVANPSAAVAAALPLAPPMPPPPPPPERKVAAPEPAPEFAP